MKSSTDAGSLFSQSSSRRHSYESLMNHTSKYFHANSTSRQAQITVIVTWNTLFYMETGGDQAFSLDSKIL